ncbi:MAG: protein ImuB [Candidatus Binatota bacterium]|nr:protein ImuB [Candidatus Binatota bacterium]
MARIACLVVTDFPLAACLRAEPELRGHAVIVASGREPRASLLAVSAEAAAHGIRRGLSLAQARAISGSVTVRTAGPEMLRAAEDALADVADAFSPRVESAGGGVVHLDVDGLASLFGTEEHLASSLAARTRRAGFEASVGVASSKTAALLAARRSHGPAMVLPPEREREMLSPLPLSLLEPSAELAVTLDRWGIRTVGDLGRLSVDAIASRLGEDGVALWKRAAGEDRQPLSLRPRPLRFEEVVDCEWAIDSFEPLSFLLRAALERLIARLDLRGLRAGDLDLALRLADGGREERTVAVAAPTADAKVLLALVRASFERRSPRGAVESFRLSASPERPRPVELELFHPPGPAPEALDAAIARLVVIAGPDRVGRPVVVSSHRPEAFALDRFAPPERPAPRTSGTVSVLALRAFRPPPAVHVVCDRGRPDYVSGEPTSTTPPIHGRVVTLAGPWRLQGEWWSEAPLARDYYDAELTDGAVYRIYREHQGGRWFAEGTYD